MTHEFMKLCQFSAKIWWIKLLTLKWPDYFPLKKKKKDNDYRVGLGCNKFFRAFQKLIWEYYIWRLTSLWQFDARFFMKFKFEIQSCPMLLHVYYWIQSNHFRFWCGKNFACSWLKVEGLFVLPRHRKVKEEQTNQIMNHSLLVKVSPRQYNRILSIRVKKYNEQWTLHRWIASTVNA